MLALKKQLCKVRMLELCVVLQTREMNFSQTSGRSHCQSPFHLHLQLVLNLAQEIFEEF